MKHLRRLSIGMVVLGAVASALLALLALGSLVIDAFGLPILIMFVSGLVIAYWIGAGWEVFRK